jgi:hypothetical protein
MVMLTELARETRLFSPRATALAGIITVGLLLALGAVQAHVVKISANFYLVFTERTSETFRALAMHADVLAGPHAVKSQAHIGRCVQDTFSIVVTSEVAQIKCFGNGIITTFAVITFLALKLAMYSHVSERTITGQVWSILPLGFAWRLIETIDIILFVTVRQCSQMCISFWK